MLANEEDDIFAIFDMLKEDNEEDDTTLCKNCKTAEYLINDSGLSICTQCGLTGAQHIDNGPEWNNYSNDMGVSQDQARCSYSNGNNDLFYGDMDSITNIVLRGRKNRNYNLVKWNKILQISPKDRSLLKVYSKIDHHCFTNSIPDMITKSTKLLYKCVASQKLSRGMVREAMLGSCLYYSFISHGYPRTVVEVSDIIGLPDKKVNRTNKILAQMIWDNPNWKEIISKCSQSSDYIHRFCCNLNMEQKYIQHVNDVCDRINNNEVFIGRDSSYKAAISIYVVTKEYNISSITKDQICSVCNLSSVTLNKLIKAYDTLNKAK